MKRVGLGELRRVVVEEKKRLLGFDVGLKYLGISVSDQRCRIAIPLSVLTLKQSSFMRNVENLAALTKEYNTAGFVVGYPLNISGSRSSQTVKVEDFVKGLQKTKKFDDMLYIFQDERFTSRLVERVLMGYKFGPCEHKAIVDKFSAVNILQASSIINFLFTDKNIREKVIKLPALLFLVI